MALLFLSASSLVKPTYDYNEDYDFSQVESFATAPRSPIGRANAIVSDMTHEFIEDSMVDTLKEHGLEHVGTIGGPDVIVSYHVVTHSQEDLETYNSNRDYQCWRCEPATTTDTQEADPTEGTLIIDMIDTKSNKPIWRAVATKHIKPKKTPKARRAMVQKVIEAMFEGFPPESYSRASTENETETETETAVE